MSNIESETLEFWERKKADYEECLEQELAMDNPDDLLIELLKDHIEEFERKREFRNVEIAIRIKIRE